MDVSTILRKLWWTTPMNKLLWYVNMIFMEEMIICGYLAMAMHKELPVAPMK